MRRPKNEELQNILENRYRGYGDALTEAMARELLELRKQVVINTGPCQTTHSACDCVVGQLKRLAAAEAVVTASEAWFHYCENELGHDHTYLTDLRAAFREYKSLRITTMFQKAEMLGVELVPSYYCYTVGWSEDRSVLFFNYKLEDVEASVLKELDAHEKLKGGGNEQTE